MQRRLWILLVLGGIAIVMACVNRVGAECTSDADCGTHEICMFGPAVFSGFDACDAGCRLTGVCNTKPPAQECSTPPNAGISCATGKTIYSPACTDYFTEPARSTHCRSSSSDAGTD